MKTNVFKKFGVMIDCSRNAVMSVKTFKKLVDVLTLLGYNTIRMYTEDTYEVDGEPYFGYLRGRYTKAEIKEMDSYAASKGMELIPCIQTLAHLRTIFKYGEYRAINDVDDILLVGEERTYELIDHMFKTISETFSTKNIHIGMDEAFKLGKGRFLDKNGLWERAEIMKKHLDRVLALAEKYGFRCEIWGDMYMHSAYGALYEQTKDESERVKALVPQGLKLCYWDYYHTEVSHYEACIDRHRKLTDNVSVGGGIWTWIGFCPNNRYSLAISEAAVRASINKGVDEFYFTMWGDDGGECSPFAALPSLVAGAEFAKGNFDMPSIKAIFQEKFGIEFDLFASLEKPNLVYVNEGDAVGTECPTKAMLYTDTLCGVFDANIQEGRAPAYYGELSALLKTGEGNAEWGYLFKSMRTLCDVLEVKFDLGVKTRKAYRNGDRVALERIVSQDYTALLARLEAFYEAFENAWMRERKPFGFEIQDIRIGGVIQRVKHCKRMLEKYLNGELEQVAELEEEILPPFGWQHGKVSGSWYGNLPTTGVL